MYRKFFILLPFLLFFSCAFATSQVPKKIKLNYQFKWKGQSENSARKYSFKEFNVADTILISTSQADYSIVVTDNKIVNEKFPITLALLVKVIQANAEQVDLQFQIVQYGFSEGGTIWMQPRLTIKNGQTASLQTATSANTQVSLNIKGTWLYTNCQPEDIHCTHYIGNEDRKDGRFIRATFLSKQSSTHIHCVSGGLQDIIPSKSWKEWIGKNEFSYEQCFDARCKQSKSLGKDTFTVTKSGENYVASPHESNIYILKDYGKPCEV